MRKSYLFIAGAMICASGLMAQYTTHRCETDHAMLEVFENDPAAKARFEQSQKQLDQMIATDPRTIAQQSKLNGNNTASLPVYALDTIPIVFHILHTYGPENISDATVIAALDQVNKDFRKLSPDTTQIEPTFIPIADRANIVFKLATKDPNGNCTNGIIHHYDPNTVWDRTAATNNGLNNYTYTGTTAGKWDPRKYLNVYIVKDIYTGSSSGGIVVGYTYLPGTWSAGNKADAIVYNYQFLGGLNARSLSHEIGHWLNLSHTFGSTNNPGVSCGDDGVTDTPVTKGYFSTCPKSNPTTGCSTIENIENIMDYSSCPKMFSAGQVTRMRTAMTGTAGGRNNLTTAANKVATGIRNPLGPCKPVADFYADKFIICQGASVNFTDMSWNGTVTNWNWTFTGATTPNSTVQNPNGVVYGTVGTWPVKLVVSNAGGADSVTKTAFIEVRDSMAQYQTCWAEDFETNTLPGSDWTLNTAGTIGWTVNNSVAYSGSKSIYINNLANTGGDIDEVYGPSMSLASIGTNPAISFRLAFQQNTSANADKLRLMVSSDCGRTWVQRYSKAGATLNTTGTTSGTAFVPNASQWRLETVTVPTYWTSRNFRFKFEYTADGTNGAGNNVYIDDIKLTTCTPTSVADINLENNLSLSVYPNPSSGSFNTTFTLLDPHFVNLFITDVVGRTIETAENGMISAGEFNYKFGKNGNLSAGVYVVNLVIDGKRYTQKVIIN